MYRYGPPESFATPTTAGSDCGAAPVTKASRALFDGARTSRLSETAGHSASKQRAGRSEQTEADARANWLGELTEEDLQELWRHTSIFPLITKADSTETPNGCELEVVQQQQIAYLAQLLKDKACSGQAVQRQSHPRAAAHFAQSAPRGSHFAGSRNPDSLQSNHGAGHNSSKSAATMPATSADPSAKAQHDRIGQRELQPRWQSRPALLPIHSKAGCWKGNGWHEPEPAQRQVDRSANADEGVHCNAQTPRTDWRQTHQHMRSAHPAQLNQHHFRPDAGVSGTGRQIYDTHQSPFEFDAAAQAAYAGNPQRLQNSHFDSGSPQMLSGSRQGPEQARAVLQAMAAQQRQEQAWGAQRSLQLTSPTCHSPDEVQMQSPQLIMPSHRGVQQSRAVPQGPSWAASHGPVQQGRAMPHGPLRQGKAVPHSSLQQGRGVTQGPMQQGTVRQNPHMGTAAATHGNRHPSRRVATAQPCNHDSASDQSGSLQSASATSSASASQAGAASIQQPRTSHRLGLKRKQAALLAGNTEASDGPASKKISATGEQVRRHSADLPATSEPSQAATSTGTMRRPAIHSAAEDAAGGVSHAGMSAQSKHTSSSVSACDQHDKGINSASGLARAFQEVDLLTDPSDALGFSPERIQIQDDLPGLQDYLGWMQDDLPADPVQGLAVPSWSELLTEAAGQLTPQGFPRSAPVVAQRPTFAWTDSPAAQHQRYDMGMGMMPAGMQSSQQPMPSASAHLDPSTASKHNALMRFISSGGSFAQQHRQSQDSREHPAAADQLCTDTNSQSQKDYSHSMPSGSRLPQQAGTALSQSQNPAGAAAKPPKYGAAPSERQGRATQPGHAQASQHVSQHESLIGPGNGQKATAGQARPLQQSSKKQTTGTLGTVLPFAMLKGVGMDSDLSSLNSRIQATVLQPSGGARPASHPNLAAATMPENLANTSQAMSHGPSDDSLMELSQDPSSKKKNDRAMSCSTEAQTAVSHGNVSDSANLPGRNWTRSGKACGAATVQLLKLSGTTKVGLPV